MRRNYVISSLIAMTAICVSIFLWVNNATNLDQQAYIEEFPTPADTIVVEEAPPNLLFGFPVDSYNVLEGKVKWNQNLAEIFANYNISYDKILAAVNASKEVFDVRKFAAKKNYTLICENDSIGTLRQFIYEPNPLEYVAFNFVDSIYVVREEKEIEIRERVLAGVIESSLYEALLGVDAGPQLVDQMVDVYAWQIDFFRIQKGDRFKLIVDEQLVDGEIVGIEKIKAAYFEHFNEPYYAVYFDQGSGVDYFDEEGNSLRKAFLRAPLNFSRISSRYTKRRYHPVLKRYKAHLGTDYAAPTGTPIRTVGDGVVLEATYKRNNGNYVKIRHNSTYTTQYLHMSKIKKGVRAGAKVRQGDIIGYVGSTGLATGPHLCFRFWKNGQQVDALKVKVPPSEPIKEEYAARYDIVKQEMMKRLDNIQFDDSSQKLYAKVTR